jgi:isocitrate lyase
MTRDGTLWMAEAEALEQRWATDPRWKGIRRDYTALDVIRLRGSVRIEYTLARRGAERLWQLLHTEPYVATFGALTGAQAVQMVRAGLKAIYVSGWQVAADANLAGQTYPDQSLYPVNSVPALVRRIQNALLRADQIDWVEGHRERDWLVPIVADTEAGFGGIIHAFELMKAMIEAGAAGVHFEDQLAAEKKCGHLGGKVLIPTGQFIRILNAARLAADVLDVPTLLIARTDARSATLLTSDIDERDRPFLTGERTPEGYFVVRGGLESAIARALAYAPYADLLWFETSRPDLEEARRFAEAIHATFPGKLLAYNCSPSFNWKRHLDDAAIARFQRELAAMGYKFQFITLAGWHLLNLHTFELARSYRQEGMSAYVRPPGGRVRPGGGGIHGGPPPAGGGDRLLRRRGAGRHPRGIRHGRPRRLHRSRTVPRNHPPLSPPGRSGRRGRPLFLLATLAARDLPCSHTGQASPSTRSYS